MNERRDLLANPELIFSSKSDIHTRLRNGLEEVYLFDGSINSSISQIFDIRNYLLSLKKMICDISLIVRLSEFYILIFPVLFNAAPGSYNRFSPTNIKYSYYARKAIGR